MDRGSHRHTTQGKKQKVSETMVRVLIVDDIAWMRARVREQVAKWPGTAVVGEAADGCEAVRQAEALHPDVIIMDQWMPLMKGLEAARFIKAKWPPTRIIMHSSSGITVEQAQAWGCEGSVGKEQWAILRAAVLGE